MWCLRWPTNMYKYVWKVVEVPLFRIPSVYIVVEIPDADSQTSYIYNTTHMHGFVCYTLFASVWIGYTWATCVPAASPMRNCVNGHGFSLQKQNAQSDSKPKLNFKCQRINIWEGLVLSIMRFYLNVGFHHLNIECMHTIAMRTIAPSVWVKWWVYFYVWMYVYWRLFYGIFRIYILHERMFNSAIRWSLTSGENTFSLAYLP